MIKKLGKFAPDTYSFKKLSTIKFNFTTINNNDYHISQTNSFEEKLILVDEGDKKVGSITKLDAHLIGKKNAFPHRAFSVFLFNKNNELLLQKRSLDKVTFPDLWSNTCCSHPLNTESESIENDNVGIKLAAQRRMDFELGFKSDYKEYKLIEKILYRADSDKKFEEFELDYVLLMKRDNEETELFFDLNKHEVSAIKFIGKDELKEILLNKSLAITPWFSLILQKKIDQIFSMTKNFGEIKEKEKYPITNFL